MRKATHSATLQRPKPQRGVFWCLLLTLVLGLPAAFAADNGTIGSLPSSDGGGDGQNFFLTGPRGLVYDAIVDAYGEGYYVAVDLPGNLVWIEFYGSDVTVIFDEVLLASHPELSMGLTAGFEGGGMLVLPRIDGALTGQRWTVGMGYSMPLPYGRIEGLLSHELELVTVQKNTFERGWYDFTSGGGLLAMNQSLK